jgi:hypothetical protein
MNLTNKMNPDVKQRWVSALKSGEYQQTKNQLRNSEGFCCLGVLCELYRQENQTAQWIPGFGDNLRFYLTDKEHSVSTSIPFCVQEWAELPASDPMIGTEPGIERSLVDLNDTVGYSFIQIADAIEAQL